MGAQHLLAASLILLAWGLAAAGQGNETAEAPSTSLLSQVQESLRGYWATAKTAAQDLYQRTYLPAVDEKIRDMYGKGTAAVTTYFGILTDQVLTMWQGD